MDFYKKLREFHRSKNVKTLLENFAYLSLLQVAGYVFPLLTYPYLAKVIGTEGFGKIAFASAVMIWLQTITDWGFNYTATRDVAVNRDNKEKISQIFSSVTWARVILMSISYIILVVCVLVIPMLREMWVVLLMTSLILPGQILFPEWLFQGIEKMKYITWLSLISKIFFTACVFVFIREKDDYILQPLFVSLGFMVSGLISLYFIMVRYGIRLKPFSRQDTIMAIKGSGDVFLNHLMPNLYNAFSVLLLGVWGGSVSNGIFDAGKKLVDVSNSFFAIVSRTFYPFLSRKIENHTFYVRINVILALGVSVILFLLAPFFIDLLFTSAFTDAVVVMRIMCIGIFLLTLSDIYGKNYLILIHKEKMLRNITFFCSILGFCISIPLVYYFDYIGAAVTLTICRGLIGISTWKFATKIKKEYYEQVRECGKISESRM